MYEIEGKIIAANSHKEAFQKYLDNYVDGDQSSFCGHGNVFEEDIEVTDRHDVKKKFNATVEQVYVNQIREVKNENNKRR